MGPFHVIKIDVILYLVIQFQTIVRWFEINFLILEATPEPFNEDIVDRPPLAVHAELQVRMQGEVPPKIKTGKLAPLVSVQYLRCAMSRYSLFKALTAPPGGHRVGQRPAHDITAVNIDDGHQVHVAAG